MEEQYTTFTVRDPKTNRKVYIPISHKDLRTKTQEQIQEVITAVIEATLKRKDHVNDAIAKFEKSKKNKKK
jgi:hypothetical protein